jgi:hypothetical protein
MAYDQFVDVLPLGSGTETKNVMVRIFPTGPLSLVGPDTLVVVRSRGRSASFLQ